MRDYGVVGVEEWCADLKFGTANRRTKLKIIGTG